MSKLQLIAAICAALAFGSPALLATQASAHDGGGHGGGGRSGGMHAGSFGGAEEARGGRSFGNGIDHRFADGVSHNFNDHRQGRRFFDNSFADDKYCSYPQSAFDRAERAPYVEICPN